MAPKAKLSWLLVAFLVTNLCSNGYGLGLEVFGKGSVSRSYIADDKWTTSLSLTGGMAFAIFSRIRIEGRYSNMGSLQNKLELQEGDTIIATVNDFKIQTALYSLGVDIELLGEKSPFQPFIFLGGGYVETERSYYITQTSTGNTSFHTEPKKRGVSANLGLGFKLKLAKSIAFEIEVFAYSQDADKPRPLVNIYGTAGIRLYL